jgi:AcrR family transcriptional regulator
MTDERQSTVRQRKQAATAQRIERSAVALVLEHGLDHVTVDMICEAAAVSQRTFFNYFKTKDAAILGANPPRLDELQVREFLASNTPNLLGEIMGLIAGLVPVDTSDPVLASSRFRIISETPLLLHKEIERLFAVRAEMEEILYLRMRRTAPSRETAAQTREQSALITHLVAGILRFETERASTAAPDLGVATDIGTLLTTVVPKLTGRAADGPASLPTT